jgi:glutaredoxin 3
LENLDNSNQIVIYGTQYCPYCIAARQLFDAKSVQYQYIAVDNNPDLRDNLIQRSGQRTVPQIWIGEQHIGGFTDLRKLALTGELDHLLSA